MDLLTIMQTGGNIMWALFALSITAAAVAAERVLFYATRRSSDAIERAAHEAVGADGAELRHALEAAVRHEIFFWEARLSVLDTIARISPLLGLLGTVIGMVTMFQSLGASSSVSSQTVTDGIWKALFTTIAGLAVAIPCTAVSSLLTARVDREEERLRSLADYAAARHARRN